MVNREKPLAALFDWDGTIRRGFVLTDWSNYLHKNGLFRDSAFGEITWLFWACSHGKVSYLELIKQSERRYLEDLRGASVAVTHRLGKAFVKQDDQVYEFPPALFERLRRRGLRTTPLKGGVGCI